jgi:hypothetical protein
MTLPTQPSPRVAALLKKNQATRAHLIFALDATASREATWDMASQSQAAMFEEAAKIGGIDVQLLYNRGPDEVRHSSWFSDPHELVGRMSAIRCMAGATKIARVLGHIRSENEREKVNAAVFIGDACEEMRGALYDAAANSGVPLFVFQEGDGLACYVDQYGTPIAGHPPTTVEEVFRELARLTGGAYARFDAGAANKLGELLRAVTAFAVGGIAALTHQDTESARKLLSQIKK